MDYDAKASIARHAGLLPGLPEDGVHYVTTTIQMDLRAYIATAALQGLLDRRDIGGSIPAHATLADTAVELADALLAELAK